MNLHIPALAITVMLPALANAQFLGTNLISTSNAGLSSATHFRARTASVTTLSVGGVQITGGSAASSDRIISSSANVAAGNGGTVSFTTGGVSGTAYLDAAGRLVTPGISATANVSSNTTLFIAYKVSLGANNTSLSNTLDVSGTFRLRPGSGSTDCTSNNYGEFKVNAAATQLSVCTVQGWKTLAE